MNLTTRTQATGYFAYEVINSDGDVTSSGEFDNLFLNSGIDWLATSASSALDTCSLGNTAADPNPADTTIPGYVRALASPDSTSDITRNSATAPYYVQFTRMYESTIGGATGTYTAIGVGYSANSVIAWSKIKDAGGTPTTITVLSFEMLRVYYRVRIYATGPASVTGSVEVSDGVGTTTHTWTAYRVGFTTGTVFTYVGSNFALNGGNAIGYDGSGTFAVTPPSDVRGYVAITNSVTANAASVNVAGYTAGTYYRDVTFYAGISNCNFADGIRGLNLWADDNTGINAWTIIFDVPIPKTSTKTFSMTLRCYYGRYEP